MFSMDDSLLIARGGIQYECAIKIWNTKTGELKSSKATHDLDARAIALSPNGEFLAFNESSDSLSLLQLRSEQISTRFTTKDKFPQTLSISPNSKMLLLGSDGFHDMHMGDDYDKTLLLWRMDDTVPQLELTGHDSDVKTSAFSPDGALIVCGLENGSVPLWDTKTGDLITHVTQKDKKKELYIEKEQSGEFQWTKFFWICTAIIYSVRMLQHRRHDCLPSYRVLLAMIKSLDSWQKMFRSPEIYGTSSSLTFERSSLPMAFSLLTIASKKNPTRMRTILSAGIMIIAAVAKSKELIL
jgi:WD40 repeat protein